MSEELTTVATVVTKREEAVDRNVVALTPDDVPDVKVVAMSMTRIMFVRALRTYLTALTGILSAGGIGLDQGALPNEFGPLLLSALQMSLGPAVMSLLLNGTELLTKVDQSWPQVRA